jgi:hypothetical protein
MRRALAVIFGLAAIILYCYLMKWTVIWVRDTFGDPVMYASGGTFIIACLFVAYRIDRREGRY